MKRIWQKLTGGYLALVIILVITTFAWAATNFLPQYHNKGTIGSSLKTWGEGWFRDVTVTGTLTARYHAYAPAQNQLENADLAIWSGGTVYATSGVSGVPDGWYIHDATGKLYGASRVDLSSVISGGTQVYEPHRHSMYVINTSNKSGASPYLVYPASGVSTAAEWYKPFRNELVQFGAWVHTDADTGGATNFIRPFINTSSATWSTSSMAFGKYATGGWQFLSAVTTVPAGGTALAFGFQVNEPGSPGSGLTAYICGPTFVTGTTVAQSILRPQQTVTLSKTLDVWSGGSTFGAMGGGSAGTTLDLSGDNGWLGIIPDDVQELYVTTGGLIQSVGDPLHFYAANIGANSGVTLWSYLNGVSPFLVQTWIPVSSTGTITVDNVAAVTGVSMIVHKAKLK